MITQYQIDGELDANRLIENLADDDMRSLVGEIAMIDWDAKTVSEDIRRYAKQLVDRKRKRIRTRLQQELAKAEAEGNQARADDILTELKGYGL